MEKRVTEKNGVSKTIKEFVSEFNIFSKVKDKLGMVFTENEDDFDGNYEEDYNGNDDIYEEDSDSNEKKGFSRFFYSKKKEKEEVESRDNSYDSPPLQTIFFDPKKFEDTKKISDYIKQGQMINMNLESLDKETAQRVVDFLAGAMKIKEAKFIKVSKQVYSIIPKNMSLYFEGGKKSEKTILNLESED